eukprot:CAMPEP_0171310578 /NCGR_PEP_ID=MMETSP0816-20121228/20752_1 /TAXON_ID=420281 /ORGANISM="Proboscia inermis, Strain CCAP1064/1" /LENGTH=39 /DNA_ID= /DNA_START= /DNA_END= /DNA_ORIENTATION=
MLFGSIELEQLSESSMTKLFLPLPLSFSSCDVKPAKSDV